MLYHLFRTKITIFQVMLVYWMLFWRRSTRCTFMPKIVVCQCTLIEEVGESLVLEGSPTHGTRRTVVEVTLQEATGVSAKGRICGAAEAAAVTRGSSPLTSELSMGKMHPEAPGWNNSPSEAFWTILIYPYEESLQLRAGCAHRFCPSPLLIL